MSVAEAIASAGMQKSIIIHIWRFLIMESISVKKSEVIRFRVAELMHKVARFVKSFNYRMEVIK